MMQIQEDKKEIVKHVPIVEAKSLVDSIECDLEESSWIHMSSEIFKMLIKNLKISSEKLLEMEVENEGDNSWILNLEAGLEVLDSVDLSIDHEFDEQMQIIQDYKNACSSALESETFYMISYVDPNTFEIKNVELSEDQVDELITNNPEEMIDFIQQIEKSQSEIMEETFNSYTKNV